MDHLPVWVANVQDTFLELNAHLDHVIAERRRRAYGYVLHEHDGQVNGYDYVIAEAMALKLNCYDVAHLGSLRFMLRIPETPTMSLEHSERFEAVVKALQDGWGDRILRAFDDAVPVGRGEEGMDIMDMPEIEVHDLERCPFCKSRIEYVDHDAGMIYLADSTGDAVSLREFETAATQRSIYRCTDNRHFLGTDLRELEAILRATQLRD